MNTPIKPLLSRIKLEFVVAILAGCSLSSNHPSDISYPIHTVPNVSSDEDIPIDVAIDDKGTIHLIWQSKEKGMQYQASRDGGKNWYGPITIASEVTYSIFEGPRIFSYKDNLNIFWRHSSFNLKTSFDRGQTWSSEPIKLFEKTPIAKYEMVANDQTIYFAYNNHEGLFLRKSNDFGHNWTDSKTITGFKSSQSQLSASSIAIWKSTIYLLWSELDTQSTLPISGFYPSTLFLAISQNRGETWSTPIEIDVDRSQHSSVYRETYSLISPTIVASQDGLVIFFEDRGLFYQSVNGKTNEWSTPGFVSHYPSRNFSVIGENETDIDIIWSDARYQQKDWWGYIPAHEILTWDKDPSWVNNDLFFTSIRNRNRSETILLTPPLSYISSNKHSISINKTGNLVYIFWCGREKVSKIVDEYGYPVKIFFVVLPRDK